MNKLPRQKRIEIISLLTEGMSIRSVARVTGASINTVLKLVGDAGRACSDYQDHAFRNLTCKRLQVDEIWSFVHAKAKNVKGAKAAPQAAGDIWTWTAIDADTKLILSWYVGSRDAEAASTFISDLAERLAGRVQLTSDGHKPYVEAVETSFGNAIDYAMLVKHYGTPEGAIGRDSPGECIGVEQRRVEGRP
jgi:IS1 family transposase